MSQNFLNKNCANTETHSFPVDTGRKLNVQKIFRRRPGRLLNVFCTFNLRPVSTGFANIYANRISDEGNNHSLLALL